MTTEVKQIVDRLAPYIAEEIQTRGLHVPIGAVISQILCESGNFKSSLWIRYFNGFGMKCGSSWKGKSVNLKTKEEYTVGTLTSISANFRVYDNEREGIKGYFDFLCGMSRYKNCLQVGDNEAIKYFQALKDAGWATSSTYVNTLTTIYNTNSLSNYNKTSYRKLTKDEVKKLQTLLNELTNDNLVVDGIIGPKTKASYNRLSTMF